MKILILYFIILIISIAHGAPPPDKEPTEEQFSDNAQSTPEDKITEPGDVTSGNGQSGELKEEDLPRVLKSASDKYYNKGQKIPITIEINKNDNCDISNIHIYDRIPEGFNLIDASREGTNKTINGLHYVTWSTHEINKLNNLFIYSMETRISGYHNLPSALLSADISNQHGYTSPEDLFSDPYQIFINNSPPEIVGIIPKNAEILSINPGYRLWSRQIWKNSINLSIAVKDKDRDNVECSLRDALGRTILQNYYKTIDGQNISYWTLDNYNRGLYHFIIEAKDNDTSPIFIKKDMTIEIGVIKDEDLRSPYILFLWGIFLIIPGFIIRELYRIIRDYKLN